MEYASIPDSFVLRSGPCGLAGDRSVGYPYHAYMIEAIALLLSWLPAPVQVLVLGLLAVLVFVVVFRIIAMVLNAIPFL